MANDDSGRWDWFRERQAWVAWVWGIYWLYLPLFYGFGLHDHDRAMMGFAIFQLEIVLIPEVIALIWQAPHVEPPRSRNDRAAITVVGLSPFLAFAFWPGDPLSFEALRALAPVCFVAALAAVVLALVLRPLPPRTGRWLWAAGAGTAFALLAAYVDVLFIRAHAGSVDFAICSAILLAPVVPLLALIGIRLGVTAFRAAANLPAA